MSFERINKFEGFMKSKIALTVIFILAFNFCSSGLEEKGSREYIEATNEWHLNRVDRLKQENGWLNLAGLYWLENGNNSFGADLKNDLVFPKGFEAEAGTFKLDDSVVTVILNEESRVLINDSKIVSLQLKSDVEDSTTIMSYNNFKWFLIKRGDKFGIRLRDLNAELVNNFPGIQRFPVNEDWKIKAKFIEYNPPKQINIPTIIGTVDVEDSPGFIEFEVQNTKYKMDAIKSGDGLFFVFADLTSGEETYGAGRFLYSAGPNENNEVLVDFNKSYNPPCAFTKYATCPLPPEQNRLKIRITAGEMNFGSH